jgi:SAM-dependent methyltransferase
LDLAASPDDHKDVPDADLRCPACGAIYPILRSIPRFVPKANYTDNFGLQWNRFRQTQLDSHLGLTISRDRFVMQTGWSVESLKGASVLDAGCGAGRFAEVALSLGAEVYAIDYSSAVDACWENLGAHPRLHVLQADIYRLPFAPASFDFVYSFGVLQHTPDVHSAFLAVARQARPGGSVAVDVYPRSWKNYVWPKYWLRPLTSRVPPRRLFGLVEKAVPVLWPVSRALGRAPRLGRQLRHLLPIANYEGMYPLSEAQLREWAVLDTFDMLAPAFDSPQSVATLRSWFEEAGLEGVEVFRKGQVVGRGRVPQSAGAAH